MTLVVNAGKKRDRQKGKKFPLLPSGLLQVRWTLSCERLILLPTGAPLLQARFTLPQTRHNFLREEKKEGQTRKNNPTGRRKKRDRQEKIKKS
jgi:hypothetical protein